MPVVFNGWWLKTVMVTVMVCAICCAPESVVNGQTTGDLKRFEQTRSIMGVACTIAAYADDLRIAEAAFNDAFDAIEQIDRLFSNYRNDSALKQLEAETPGKTIPLDDEMWPLFEAAESVAAMTDGAFDYTLGNLTRMWREIRRARVLPDPERLAQARGSSGHYLVQLNRTKRELTINHPDLEFDFGGIAKGYAADLALDRLKRHGVERAIVNLAGDIAIGSSPPDAEGWKIGITDLVRPSNREQTVPVAESGGHFVLLSRCGVATSGDRFQFVEIEGIRYSHILDPRSGLGVSGFRNVTVIADSACRADALASAFNVMEFDAIEELWRKNRDLKVRIQYFDSDGQLGKQWQSENFPAIESTGH